MTVEEIRRYFPKALQLARDKANLSWEQASRKSGVSSEGLQNHEGGINLPNMDKFFDELKAYGLDFMSFHELLLEAKIREQVGWKTERRDIQGRIIPPRKMP
jgi:hypothetical protein